jgi:hypothetical protein
MEIRDFFIVVFYLNLYKKIMNKKLLFGFICFMLFFNTKATTISILGSGVNGWEPTAATEITLSSTDDFNFTILNLPISNGAVKFRQDLGWTINWGSNATISGIAIQDGNNIVLPAGNYNVFFNRITDVYSFMSNGGFPKIGIWGPAVDSQNGFAGNDIAMTTTDGVNYYLSGFNYSSGNAYFRENNNGNVTYGSTAFPFGIGAFSGPSINIIGAEYFVTFNRYTGEYRFETPTIGILGDATPTGWEFDTNMETTDNSTYTLTNFILSDGELKFRKDNLWLQNWGNNNFPTGVADLLGNNIFATAGMYNVSFNVNSRAYSFQNTLNLNEITTANFKVFPNPSNDIWHFESKNESSFTIEISDMNGKIVFQDNQPKTNSLVAISNFAFGIYFAKITTKEASQIIKLIKN